MNKGFFYKNSPDPIYCSKYFEEFFKEFYIRFIFFSIIFFFAIFPGFSVMSDKLLSAINPRFSSTFHQGIAPRNPLEIPQWVVP